MASGDIVAELKRIGVLDNDLPEDDASNTSLLPARHQTDVNYTARDDMTFGHRVYANAIPFIIVVGLIGNGLSLKVFSSHALRHLAARHYLMALAVSDSVILLTGALTEWLRRGLSHWTGGSDFNIVAVEGICQVYLLIYYMFRFTSAWLIVLFTVERYIAVSWPLHCQKICRRSVQRRVMLALVVTAAVLSSWKPILSGVRKVYVPRPMCAAVEGNEGISHILDVVYGTLITAVPFLIIALFNCLITLRLRSSQRRKHQLSGSAGVVKVEFTVMLLLVSMTFVVLNFPYFVVWCMEVNRQTRVSLPDKVDSLRDWIALTKTIFCLNYCCNIFLYSFTGQVFRKQLRAVMCRRVQSTSKIPSTHTELIISKRTPVNSAEPV